MKKNTWARSVQVSATLTANIECPECGEIHTIQQELHPDDPEYSYVILDQPWFVRPCSSCKTDIIYHFDIDIRAWARICEEGFSMAPKPEKQKPKQLTIFS